MNMNKVLTVDIGLQLKSLMIRFSSFIFPEPVTPYLQQLMIQELFDSYLKAVRTGEDAAFPSLSLVTAYGIEGVYESSFFCRNLAKFQQEVNQVFLNHGIFDEVSSGSYTKAKLHKGRLVLFNDAGSPVSLKEYHNDYKQAWLDQTGSFEPVPSRVPDLCYS